MAIAKTSANCPWCGRYGELQASHSIPRSFFSLVNRKSRTGQLFRLTSDRRATTKSQDSGAAPMLCKRCESEFNKNFDKPIAKLLIAESKCAAGKQFSSRETTIIVLFMLSVVWRAAHSTNELYNALPLSKHVYPQLQTWIETKNFDAIHQTLNFRIHYLIDSSRRMPLSKMNEVIMPPKVIGKSGVKGEYAEIWFVCAGYCFCLDTQDRTWKERKKQRYIVAERPFVTTPISLFSIPGMIETAIATSIKKTSK